MNCFEVLVPTTDVARAAPNCADCPFVQDLVHTEDVFYSERYVKYEDAKNIAKKAKLIVKALASVKAGEKHIMKHVGDCEGPVQLPPYGDRLCVKQEVEAEFWQGEE